MAIFASASRLVAEIGLQNACAWIAAAPMHPSCIKWLVARFALSEIPGLVQTMVCTHGVSQSILVIFTAPILHVPMFHCKPWEIKTIPRSLCLLKIPEWIPGEQRQYWIASDITESFWVLQTWRIVACVIRPGTVHTRRRKRLIFGLFGN